MPTIDFESHQAMYHPDREICPTCDKEIPVPYFEEHKKSHLADDDASPE